MLRFDRVGKRYADGTVAVRELSLDVTDGEVCVLIGPSGCGKTTVLKMANRLVQPSSGRVLLDGEDVTTSDPVKLRRRIGYVIQSVGLFPHLTVAGNVGTLPRLLGWDRRRTASRVAEMLTLVGLDPRLHGGRYPHELSGGQRQRVGVARALAADPPVLLMDEPFGAVDPVARDRLQGEFLRLQQQVRKTVVFVTHDLDEAVRLGDRVAVLSEGGVLEQHDTPGRLLARPKTPFVTEFVGADRAVRRLSVTPLDRAALLEVPTVARDRGAQALSAAARTSRSGFVVVVDGENRPVGWVGDGPATTADALPALPATVALGTDLRGALAAVLQSPTAWAVALDGEAYAGVVTLEGVHAALGRDQDARTA